MTSALDLDRTTCHGRSITHAPQHEQYAGYNVLTHDAGRRPLARALDHSHPSLPLSPGVSISAGQHYWRNVVSRAPHDLLVLGVERVLAASSRRCVTLGCRSPHGERDLAYCPEHRVQADSGVLWACHARSEMT